MLREAKERRIDTYVCPKVAQRYKQTNHQGKCIGDGLVNIDVMRVIRWIGVETSVAVEGRKRKTTVLGFHSLRHSFASFCAEAGVPKAVVVSILGANSDIIDSFYTHVGEDLLLPLKEVLSEESIRKDFSIGPKKHWTGKEKLAIVLQGLKGGCCISTLCNEHGITQGMYYKWRDQRLTDGAKLFEWGGVDHARERLERENRRLKVTIGELTIEMNYRDSSIRGI